MRRVIDARILGAPQPCGGASDYRRGSVHTDVIQESRQCPNFPHM
jgi:hypothetical protein